MPTAAPFAAAPSGAALPGALSRAAVHDDLRRTLRRLDDQSALARRLHRQVLRALADGSYAVDTRELARTWRVRAADVAAAARALSATGLLTERRDRHGYFPGAYTLPPAAVLIVLLDGTLCADLGWPRPSSVPARPVAQLLRQDLTLALLVHTPATLAVLLAAASADPSPDPVELRCAVHALLAVADAAAVIALLDRLPPQQLSVPALATLAAGILTAAAGPDGATVSPGDRTAPSRTGAPGAGAATADGTNPHTGGCRLTPVPLARTARARLTTTSTPAGSPSR